MEDRFVGSMLGLALGDAMGAKYEGGPLGQAAWWVLGIGKGDLLRWSDDTQMAMGLAISLIEKRGVDPDHLAKTWAERADYKRGYGSGALAVLNRIARGEDWRVANTAVFPEGSFGNGAAMRAAPLGLFYHKDLAALRSQTELASSITHAHPLGMEGGVLIARATALALDVAFEPARFLETLRDFVKLPEYSSRLKKAIEWLVEAPSLPEIRKQLGASIKAHESAVTAVYAFCRFPADFKGMMEFIIQLGGDTDTIGAMAGGIFGARNGTAALPAELLANLEERERLIELGRQLHRVST